MREKDKTAIVREIGRLLKDIQHMDDAAHYGVGYVNGQYRIYTVGSIRLMLNEAAEYYNMGMYNGALDIVRFVKGLYRAGVDNGN